MNNNILNYEVINENHFINFLYSPIKAERFVSKNCTISAEVGAVEDAHEVEYPCRKAFIRHRDLKSIMLKETGFDKVYTSFEKDLVDFRTVMPQPFILSTYAKTFIDCPKTGRYKFSIKTCGGLILWVNNERKLIFSAYTRNISQVKEFYLDLQKGSNELVIYFDDLAERDIRFFFQLKNLNPCSLSGHIELPYSLKEYKKKTRILYNMFLEADYFEKDSVKLNLSKTAIEESYKLRVRFNPRNDLVSTDAQDGNITEFQVDNLTLDITPEKQNLKVIDVNKFNSAGFTTIEFGLEMSNNDWLTRELTCSVYDKNKFSTKITGSSLKQRKKEALKYYSELNLDDINVGLVKAHLDCIRNLDFYEEYRSAFKLIESKGDCSDFILSPLLALYTKYNERFPIKFQNHLKKIVLDFRYWIDEPGNDVMWYFSENHALLFHSCQYFAGYLYPNDIFKVSGRKGLEQYQIGKDRLKSWFNNFLKYGFSEWNSTTYFPIDFIGFFSLYIAAPDEELKSLAKKALDYAFKLIAINYSAGTVRSTFGRVYEHNLKAMELGEISSLIEIGWGNGYFNNSLRASALFAISDYIPPEECYNLMHLPNGLAVHSEYKQGTNQARLYHYKTKDYSISSVTNYRKDKKGYQQHLINISLQDTMIWINNPGEAEFSGENRPSFWSGNGIMPELFQYKNTVFGSYNLEMAEYKFIHAYIPFWKLDNIRLTNKGIFIRKDNVYLALIFNNNLLVDAKSSVYGREVKIPGENIKFICNVSSAYQGESLEDFIKKFEMIDMENDNVVFQNEMGDSLVYNRGIKVNGVALQYTDSYDIKYKYYRLSNR